MYKIIHILGSLTAGGAETLLHSIVSKWNDPVYKHEIYYLMPVNTLEPSFNELGIPCTLIDWNSEIDILKMPDLIRNLNKDRPAIVHSHLWWGNYLIATASQLARVPVYVESIHGCFSNSKLGRFLHQVAWPIHLMQTDSVICVSEYVYNYLHSIIGLSNRKMTVIRNIIPDCDPVSIDMIKKVRSQLNIPMDNTVLITVANLFPRVKGYEIYLKALSQMLRDSHEDTTVLIVGAEQKLHKDFPEYLKKLTEQYGLSNNVIFLGYRNDIHSLLSASDLYVMPSLIEGYSLALMEALRAGLPVVSSRTGIAEEVVISGRNGVLVEPGNISELIEGIQYYLKDRKKRKSSGRESRLIFEQSGSLVDLANEYKAHYMELLNSNGIVEQS